jgi:drug/metabolite transporter (DMT)-like permease
MSPLPASGSTHKGYLLVLLAALSFGIYPAASQLAYQGGANPISLIVISTALRTLALLIAAVGKGYSAGDIYRDSFQAIGSGFLQAVSIFGIIASLRYIPGPVMITIVFSHTLMLLVLLAWRGQERLTFLSVSTSLLALLGICLVVDLVGNTDRIEWRGVTLAFIAALATASRMYAYGNQVKTAAPEIVGARAFSIATMFTLPLLLWEPPNLPTSLESVLWFALACASLMAGTVFSFKGLGIIGSFRTSLMLKIEPVLTCGYSWLMLGQLLSGSQYLGIGLVLFSLGAYQFLENRQRAKAVRRRL